MLVNYSSENTYLRVLRTVVFLTFLGLSWDFSSVRRYLRNLGMSWDFFTKACQCLKLVILVYFGIILVHEKTLKGLR